MTGGGSGGGQSGRSGAPELSGSRSGGRSIESIGGSSERGGSRQSSSIDHDRSAVRSGDRFGGSSRGDNRTAGSGGGSGLGERGGDRSPGFLDKHNSGRGQGGKKTDGLTSSSTGDASAAVASRSGNAKGFKNYDKGSSDFLGKFGGGDNAGKNGSKGGKKADGSADDASALHDHGKKLHNHETGELSSKRASKLSGDADDFLGARGGAVARHGGHHHHHHGHHHHSHWFVGVALGSPWWGWGYCDPFWAGYAWGYPGWYSWGYPGYYGGLSLGYSSGHWGFSVGTGFSPYYWPYYAYDPWCVYPARTYVVGSPAYAVVDPSPSVVYDSSASVTQTPSRSDAYATNGLTAPANPIPSEPARVDDPLTLAASNEFARQGEAAFKARDYKEAVRAWRHALVEDTKNGTLVLMLAQALFENGDYLEAAGAVQSGMMLLPKDKWDVVVAHYEELYSDSQDYVDQLKDLEKAIKDKADAPWLRFLVGYHYLYLGHPVEAVRELQKLKELAPGDKVGLELLAVAEEAAKKKTASSPLAPLPAP
jgi:hypothetical protein